MSRTETKGERKRTTATKQNSSNSSYLVEEGTPQILSLGTKPFVIFMGASFKVNDKRPRDRFVRDKRDLN